MHAKQLSRLNWERFASDIGVSSYNVLRTTYLNERNTLPITVFRKAAPLFDHTTWSNSIVGFRHAHWGQVMGGSISLKKWHAAMRKKPKSYHDLQSGRFLKARSYNYETSCGYEVRSLHELLVAENLIANGVSHDYEPALHCGNHTLFPDFLAEDWFWKGPNRAFWFSRSTDMDTIVGETQAVSVVQGSRSNIGRSSRTRQGNCTKDY